LSPILLMIYSEITERENIVIPMTFYSGIIKLVYNNRGDKNNLNNYRPINLSNTDYKIFMKILANRIKPIMPNIVNNNQAYSVPNRTIYDTVLTAKETLKDLHKNNGYFQKLDFEKLLTESSRVTSGGS